MKNLGFLLLLPLFALAQPVQADPKNGSHDGHSGYLVTDNGASSFPQDWSEANHDFGPGPDVGGQSGSGGIDVSDKNFPNEGDKGSGSDFNFGGDLQYFGILEKILNDLHDSGRFDSHDNGGDKWAHDLGGGNIFDSGNPNPPKCGNGNSGGNGDPNPSVATVPEPSTWALLFGSLAGLAIYRRFRFARR